MSTNRCTTREMTPDEARPQRHAKLAFELAID